MLKNYFTIAYRNLIKQKGFSLINFVGLALSMTDQIDIDIVPFLLAAFSGIIITALLISYQTLKIAIQHHYQQSNTSKK